MKTLYSWGKVININEVDVVKSILIYVTDQHDCLDHQFTYFIIILTIIYQKLKMVE